MRARLPLALCLALCATLASAQSHDDLDRSLTTYFASYTNPAFTSDDPIKVTDVCVDEGECIVQVSLNEAFAAQPFTQETVRRIYSNATRALPRPYDTYRLSILCNSAPIEELVPREWDDTAHPLRHWGNIEYEGNPWVTCASRQFDAPLGLRGRHLTLWASHGRYYDFQKGCWRWQRPRLYCTTEDLFTQSFVVPFLMPMLENAGAIVFTPRERDWQRNEVIVDNDDARTWGVSYWEANGAGEWRGASGGFAKTQDIYHDGETPFGNGTYRYAEAQTQRRQASAIVWQPDIPEDGDYAVYVSYATLPGSVSDAEYTVRHGGVDTKFKVNQQMGGGTWVYLGTFGFKAGGDEDNRVTLTNVSNYRGVVTADAVRFGGGMGNIARGESTFIQHISHLPRYLEGSRYTAQWSGMPYEVYGNKESTTDYAEDINTRSLMSNLLSRGSVYLPGDSGLCVPIELSLAVHSDAGIRQDNSIVGTLGIYTTGRHTQGEYEGLLADGLFPSGKSRMASRDLCDRVMTSVCSDMRKLCGTWTRRQLYDRNYSETRLPEVPSAILETLSHQNWADMRYGHDPWFKFLYARAIYKGILRFVSDMHGRGESVVQPMPVTSFAATLSPDGGSVVLSWRQGTDPTEPTAAQADYYILYTSLGDQGYDNGTRVYSTTVSVPAVRGELMRFRVAAANDGGQSMESEELCAYSPTEADGKRMLIVNGFRRLAGPQPVSTYPLLGFDMDADPGVVYRHSPCYCGRQTAFDREEPDSLGASGSEYEGILVAGNTFDYPTLHCRDILSAYRGIAISSCSGEALEAGQASTAGIQLIDYIAGAQRNDGYSLTARPCFTPGTCDALQGFTERGGALLVSGAYIAEELSTERLRQFGRDVLRLNPAGVYAICDSTTTAEGMGTSLTVRHDLNEASYCVKRCGVLTPTDGSFCTMLYTGTGQSAAVACQSAGHRALTFGFPLEIIESEATRRAIIGASVKYLLYSQP